MMPVEQGIIKADFKPFRPECIHIFTHKVAAGRGVGTFVIGIPGIEHAEAFVVLGGEHGVFHSRCFCLTGPLFCVKQIGVKMAKVAVVNFLGCFFPGFYPFMACRQRVKSPMNEHAEPVVAEPFRIAGSFSDLIAGHENSLLFHPKYSFANA